MKAITSKYDPRMKAITSKYDPCCSMSTIIVRRLLEGFAH